MQPEEIPQHRITTWFRRYEGFAAVDQARIDWLTGQRRRCWRRNSVGAARAAIWTEGGPELPGRARRCPKKSDGVIGRVVLIDVPSDHDYHLDMVGLQSGGRRMFHEVPPLVGVPFLNIT